MIVYDQYKVDVPEGELGGWRVERFEVSKSEAQAQKIRPGSGYVKEGTYTRLMFHDVVVMSDTREDVRSHLEFIQPARGRVLIHGLGLGMCAGAVLEKNDVEHVLVIEKSESVIKLVAPHYEAKYGDRFEIRQGDAHTWKPDKGQGWDFVWHDIWPGLNTDHLSEMSKLHRRFRRFCGWQGSWSRERLKRQWDHDQKQKRRSRRARR